MEGLRNSMDKPIMLVSLEGRSEYNFNKYLAGLNKNTQALEINIKGAANLVEKVDAVYKRKVKFKNFIGTDDSIIIFVIDKERQRNTEKLIRDATKYLSEKSCQASIKWVINNCCIEYEVLKLNSIKVDATKTCEHHYRLFKKKYGHKKPYDKLNFSTVIDLVPGLGINSILKKDELSLGELVYLCGNTQE